MRLPLLAVVLLLLNPALAQSADPLAGEWVCDGMTLEVNCTGDDLSGTIRRGDSSYPFTARRSGSGWAGQFKSGDSSFDCSATLENGVLTFRSGQKSYALKLKPKQASNPLDDDPPPPMPNPLGGGPAPVPAPVPSPIDPPKPQANVVRHPQGGFSCEVPEGWKSEVSDSYVELYGPMSATTGQPTAYIRAAAVVDPTFTQIDDTRYLQGAIDSMKQNEPGLTLDGDGRTFSKGSTRLVMIPFKLKVEGIPNPVPARAVLGEIANKKMAVVFMACEESRIEECEGLAIGAADDIINGCAAAGEAPKQDTGGSLDKAIIGTWSDEMWIWAFSEATLKKSMDPHALGLGKDVIINSPGSNLYHSIKDGKLYVSEKPTDAWDRAPGCDVYTVELKGDELTLTDASGKKIVLKRGKGER